MCFFSFFLELFIYRKISFFINELILNIMCVAENNFIEGPLFLISSMLKICASVLLFEEKILTLSLIGDRIFDSFSI